jgi:Domain of unknown function (DUF4082)/Bacterial Ig-like domain
MPASTGGLMHVRRATADRRMITCGLVFLVLLASLVLASPDRAAATAVPCPCTIWPSTATPTVAVEPDPNAVELGVKFRASQSGRITGVRFYKGGTTNGGTHLGRLWSSTGTKLAEATFTNESATGWQQVLFSQPLSITAGTTYVASYYAPQGRYSVDDNYFTAATARGPLTALADGTDGSNGVYRYGAGGGFPNNGFQSSNYWVDVVFEPQPDTTKPTVTSRSPAPGATGVPVDTRVSATFSESIQSASAVFTLTGSGGNAVGGATNYDDATRTATFTPNTTLAAATPFTVALSGARDAAGNVMDPTSWTFTTGAASTCPCSIFAPNATPASPAGGDVNAVEVGVKFRASQPGFITGIRFYKGPGNGGTHVGSLWTSTGTRLAHATFTGESASGWQQASFPSPVAISANTTYVASYFAPQGNYAFNANFFSTNITRGPLTAPSSASSGGNGVFAYGRGFPTGSFQSANYWVDVVFMASTDTVAPTALITSSSNPYSGYLAELLRAEGMNEFATVDLAALNASNLATLDVVVVGQVALTQAQVDLLTGWVQRGGNLIAMRPDAKLAPLLGITRVSGTMSQGYLRVNTAVEPGAGITNQTIQYHGTADRYTLNGATAAATLYTNASTATNNPAVTIRNVGTSGGQAAAFTFDLARSVVQTRQGNPAWAGQERDEDPSIIRSDDMFVPSGVQPGWVDMNKVAIPQADEQQRLLANLMLTMNRDKKPLPRFWYFPGNAKAAVVATGDDHAFGGTAQRFAIYQGNSTPGCSVANWQCLRFSSYVYPEVQLSDAEAKTFQDNGFEVALHPENGCRNFTSAADLAATYTSELQDFRNKFPSIRAPESSRFHCVVWSDWGTQFETEAANGIRVDTDYYYWPGSWIADRPGFFTGSGIPMRFARLDGTTVDVYQATTQMTDESGQSYPFTPNSLFDAALGPLGYYGFFTANMHTDAPETVPDEELVTSAKQRGVPMITSKQLLTWLDGRNSSSFTSMAWNGNTLSFTINVGAGAAGLRAMIPTAGPGGSVLSTLNRGGTGVTFTRETIKGMEYATFAAAPGTYSASYTASLAAPTISQANATIQPDGTASVLWKTNEPATSEVLAGTSQSDLTSQAVEAEKAGDHTVELKDLAPGTRYYFRVASTDPNGAKAVWPAPAEPPASFVVPAKDTVAPTVRNIQVSPLPDGTARVTWQTDEAANSTVSYGIGASLDRKIHADERVSEHEIVIRDLDPNTEYTVELRSADAAGNESAPRPVSRVTSTNAGVADQTAAAFVAGEESGAIIVDETDGTITLKPQRRAEGTFRSRVLDARKVVDWDRPVWHALLPPDTTFDLRVRTGNTREPNRTWSSWTPLASQDQPIGTRGRFLQYEVRMTAADANHLPTVEAIGFTHRSAPPPTPQGEVPHD